MVLKYPPYFFQTSYWAKFWQSANLNGHKVHYFEVKNELGFGFGCWVYEYPWFFKQRFWFVPKGPFIIGKSDFYTEYRDDAKSELLSLWEKLFSEIEQSALAFNICFLNWDFEDQFCNLLRVDKLAIKSFVDNFTQYQVKASVKNLQYSKAMVLDLSNVVSFEFQYSLENIIADPEKIKKLYQDTESFWKSTNQNIRRYTRKSIDQGWSISISKTNENFEKFWEVFSHTSKRQLFNTQTKSYIKQLFNEDFSRIIVLSKDEKPHSVWMGIETEDTLTYLYGGNTKHSFENYGQYLIHLIAVGMCVESDLKIYDLGSYDEVKGFGKFKEGYKGTIREFVGPVDIVYRLWQYNVVNLIIKAANLFRKR